MIKVQPRRRGTIVVAASWLATLQLLFHVRGVPYVFKLAVWIGVPLLSGIIVPRSWRRGMFLLAVPVLFATWLSTAPWSGTSDTPAGLHWTEVSFGGAMIIVGIQYLGFIVGLGLREVVAIRRAG